MTYASFGKGTDLHVAGLRAVKPVTDGEYRLVPDKHPSRAYTPSAASEAPRLDAATDKQLSYLDSLIAQRGGDEWLGVDLTVLNKRAASALIDELRKMPLKPRPAPAAAPSAAPMATVPAGRYAVEMDGTLQFYKVDAPTEGKWAGYTFVKVQASDYFWPVKNPETKAKVLAAIAVDPKAALVRYGMTLGSCGICGRTLTDEESRALGIGPVCAEKGGW